MLFLGINAKRIDRLKRKTGAYVYVHGEAGDPIRTVIIRGTRRQVDRAFAFIESLIEKHRYNKFPIIQRRLHGKPKDK
jgi:murein L,D-transpeptidase YafK